MKLNFKTLLFPALVFLPFQFAFSTIDSLKQQYSIQKGESRIKTGLLLSDELTEQPEQMLELSLSLAKESETVAPNSLIQARVYKTVADAYFYLDSIAQSNKYLLKAIMTAEVLVPVDTQLVGGLYNDLGCAYLETEKRFDARSCLQKAINLLNDSPYIYELADAKSNLASLNHAEGNYQEAIALYLDVYQIDLKTGDKSKQSSSLNNLGRMYVDWGKHETGLEYYFRAIELLDTITNRRTLGIRYNNIGMTYQLMGKNSDAIHWFEKAKEIEEPEGLTPRLGVRYFNLGNSYMALGKNETAESYLKKAEAIFSSTNLYSQTSKVYGSIGKLYSGMGQAEKARTYYLKSKDLAEQAGSLPEKSLSYNQLYEYYKKIGSFSEALKFFELHTIAEDSIYNLKVSEQVEKMEAQYQSKQKEAEIMNLETENQLKVKELTFKNRQRNWALAGLGLLFLVSTGIFSLFTIVRRQKADLARQNMELDKLNHTLNRLFAIISHDLRNATAAYQSSAKIIDYHLSKGQPEKLLPLSGEISSNAKNLSSMLENLLHWSVSQMKGIEPRKASLRVKDEIEKVITLLKKETEIKSIDTVVTISPEETVWCDPESFNLIIRSLMGNAIKFTERGEIRYETYKANGFVHLQISDTGCGMPQPIKENIFSTGSEKIRKGTSGEKGTGLGLLLVSEHVEKNGGNISVESEEGKGTTFTVSLPC